MIQEIICCGCAGNSLMGSHNCRVLVYGYGNPGRQDDGLGTALISRLEEARLPGVDLECNYQLNIEDADTISSYDAVIFVDAAREGQEPYSFCRIRPSEEIAFTTHAMSPGSVLALCHDIHNRTPVAYLLAIPGYMWEMAEGITCEAALNLEAAFVFLVSFLRSGKAGIVEHAVSPKSDG